MRDKNPRTSDLASTLVKILRERRHMDYANTRSMKILMGEELLIEAIEVALRIKVKALKLMDEEESRIVIDIINRYIEQLKNLLIKFYSKNGVNYLQGEEVNALIKGLEIALLINQLDPRSIDPEFIEEDYHVKDLDVI